MDLILDLRFALTLEGLAPQLLGYAEAALYEAAEAIMADSRDHFVPVDEGILKGTGHVELPERHGDESRVTLAYGGPAEAYATEQHENEAYHHTVGQAHYLSEPLQLAAGTLAHDVAARIRAKAGL
jgi:hypothetical protein